MFSVATPRAPIVCVDKGYYKAFWQIKQQGELGFKNHCQLLFQQTRLLGVRELT